MSRRGVSVMDLWAHGIITRPSAEALFAAGITSLDAVNLASDAKLLAIYRIGRVTVRNIREWMYEQGRSDSWRGPRRRKRT